jgi:hypothetical protein
MSWKEYEELLNLVDNLKEKAGIVSRLFPEGLPLNLEELNTVEKEAIKAFCDAWSALQAFRTKHPLLGAS